VLVQSTGDIGVPCGTGIVQFETIDNAIAGAASIASDYPRHAAEARRIAETHFDSNKVLAKLLDEVGVKL
jgi:pyridoxal biosynthesis lyase PdxS